MMKLLAFCQNWKGNVMTTSVHNTESKTDTEQTPPTTENKGGSGYEQEKTPRSPKAEETVDEFGYEKDPNQEPPKAEESKDDKKQAPAEEEKKVENPSTGYGKAPKKPEEEKKTEEEKKEPSEESEEQKALKEIEEVLKDTDKLLDKAKVTKFATENKLTKAQVEAYVKMVKEEEAHFAQEAKKQIEKQKADWFKELKEDKEFGGENFNKNVDRVERLLENNMPNWKKMLTERGTMLPPTIMKDLLGVAKALNPSAKFEGGEPPTPPEDKSNDNFLDEMYK